MLTIHPSTRSGISLVSRVEPGYLRDINHAGALYQDSLGEKLRGTLLQIHDVPIESLVNSKLRARWPDSPINVYGKPPFDAMRKLDPLGKRRLFQDIWSLFNGSWDFHKGDQAIKGENPVIHPNLFGRLDVGNSSTRFKAPILKYGDDDYGEALSLPYQLVVDSDGDGGTVISSGPGSATVSTPVRWVLSEENLQALKTSVEAGDFDYVEPIYGNKRTFYHDFTYQITSSAVLISYIWIISKYLGNQVWQCDVNYIGYIVGYTFTSFSPTLGVAFHVDQICDVDAELKYKVATSNWGEVNAEANALAWCKANIPFSLRWYNDHTHSTHETSPTLFSLCSVNYGRADSLLGYDYSSGLFTGYHDRSYLRFEELAQDFYPNCVSGHAVSSIDALDAHFGSLSSADHIETLGELGDVLSPLDLVKAAYLMVFRRKLGLKGLIDLVTDAKLTYSFAIAPSIKDAEEIAANAAIVYRKLRDRNLYGPNTLYGKRVFAMPEDVFPFPNSVCILRSKLRVSSNEDTLLPYILPARSLGLLPSLSSAWNLLPLSFVVDWATRTSDSLTLIENQGILQMLNFEFGVHSATILYGFSEADAEKFDVGLDFDENGNGQAGYKWYSRYVSTQIPTVTPTLLPILGETGVPDFFLAGSLLYKFL